MAEFKTKARLAAGAGARLSKGQAVPIDFMAGLFIFLIILAYFLVQWSIYSNRYLEQTQMRDTETSAIRLANQLVTSGGQPYNWTFAPLAAQSIGIAKKPNELDSYKVSALAALPYANAKQLLGMDQDFWVRIESPEGAIQETIGIQPENSARAVEVTRVAVMDGDIVDVRVQVYG